MTGKKSSGRFSETVELIGSDDSRLSEISSSMALGLSIEEMSMLRNYFTELGRNPSDVEMQAMAQAWSEHCC